MQAAIILEETLLAAKTLWEYRSLDLYQNEPFLYSDLNGYIRVPREVLGLTWNANSARPIIDVDIDSFYSFKNAYVKDITELPHRVSSLTFCSGSCYR